MIDIDEVAALLHVEEKLRAHAEKYGNILKAVRAKLDQHEQEHARQNMPPEPVPQPEVGESLSGMSPKAPGNGNGDSVRRPA